MATKKTAGWLLAGLLVAGLALAGWLVLGLVAGVLWRIVRLGFGWGAGI